MVTELEIYADVWCPFELVGLRAARDGAIAAGVLELRANAQRLPSFLDERLGVAHGGMPGGRPG